MIVAPRLAPKDFGVLIDRSHLGWGLASAAALVAATAGYAYSVAGPRVASGGSVAGLSFGVLSLAAMILAGLLAVRKKFPATRLGSAQFWLRMHIWLGLLSVPLALFHSGFRFGGTLERAFMGVFFVVIASGAYGLALQQVLPRFLKVRVPLETFPQQIPHLCRRMHAEVEELLKELAGPAKKPAPAAAPAAEAPAAVAPVATASTPAAPAPKPSLAAKLAAAKKPVAGLSSEEPAPPSAVKRAVEHPSLLPTVADAPADGPMPRLALLAGFCRDEVFPFLDGDSRAAAQQSLASENFARMALANLAVALPSRALPAIRRLEEIVAERRQFLAQERIQSWLRSWLLVHVPLSAALFVLAAVHVLAALRVVPWP